MAYIYKIINLKNNKFYIGQTKKTIEKRFSEHINTAIHTNKRHPFYDSIRSHGVENFSVSILEECSSDILLEREVWWIAKLNPVFNLTVGGTGGDTFTKKPDYMKEQTRNKLSIAAKKNSKNPEYIRKLSEASKKRWSDEEYRTYQSLNSKEKWNDLTYRQRITESSKEKWNDLTYRQRITEKAILNSKNPEYLKKVSDGVKRAIETKKDVWSECKQGSKNGRWLGSIEMYYPNGSLYKIYETAVECSKDTGIVAHNIRTKARVGESIMRGRFKGYTFKILDTGEVV